MIHPHFIVTDCLDHQVHFSHRGMTGSTLITNFPLLLTAMANAFRRRCTVTRRPLMTSVPALHHPGSAGGWSQISAAERHSVAL